MAIRRQTLQSGLGGTMLVLLLVLPVAAEQPQSYSPAGRWEGAYVRMGSIQRLGLALHQAEDKLQGSYDVPDLGIFDEPIPELVYDFPKLTMRLAYGVFEAVVHPDEGEITGVNSRWNPPVLLHLKRALPSPVPYLAHPVSFTNGNVRLAGTVYLPRGAPPFPAVVIVAGSGAQGRESQYLRSWRRFFAESGVATLVYDKRGVGESEGDYKTVPFEVLAEDAAAALRALLSRDDIDTRRVGLLGISQGGWLAPLAAYKAPGAARFLILDVGPAVTTAEQELDRVEYTMRAEEFTEGDVAEALAFTRQLFAAVYEGKDWKEVEPLVVPARTRKWAEVAGLPDGPSDLQQMRNERFDPRPILQRTTLPLLAIFGENDLLVPPARNVDKMKRYLASNPDATVVVIPRANHDKESFNSLKGGAWEWPAKYWVWGRKQPQFYQAITRWMVQQRFMPPVTVP